MTSTANSTHPYLLRAIHEWCVEGGYTPYLVARVDGDVLVPSGYVRDGQIVLNLDPHATNRLSFGPDGIGFQARFGGVAQDLWVPYPNVLALYSRENGRGIAFSQGVAFELNPAVEAEMDEGDEGDADSLSQSTAPDDPDEPVPPPQGGRGGHLKVIK